MKLIVNQAYIKWNKTIGPVNNRLEVFWLVIIMTKIETSGVYLDLTGFGEVCIANRAFNSREFVGFNRSKRQRVAKFVAKRSSSNRVDLVFECLVETIRDLFLYTENAL